MNGILIIADALDGVHLVDVTGLDTDYVSTAGTALGRFLAASADGSACWLSAHKRVDVDTLPAEIKVWPSFVSFFHQFGAEWQEPTSNA